MRLLTFAAKCSATGAQHMPLDQYLMPTGRTAAEPPHIAAVGQMGQTGGQTDKLTGRGWTLSLYRPYQIVCETDRQTDRRMHARTHARTHTHTHTRLTALCLGLPG